MFNIKFIKQLIGYLGTFPNVLSENSTKLLALLISAIAGGFVAAFVVPFCLIWDVVSNNYIKTDLTDLGIFILCVGGFQLGAGLNVKVPTWMAKKKKGLDIDEEEGGDYGGDDMSWDKRGPGKPPRHRTRAADMEEIEYTDEEAEIEGLLGEASPVENKRTTIPADSPLKCTDVDGKIHYYANKQECASALGISARSVGDRLKKGGQTKSGYSNFAFLEGNELKKWKAGKLKA